MIPYPGTGHRCRGVGASAESKWCCLARKTAVRHRRNAAYQARKRAKRAARRSAADAAA